MVLIGRMLFIRKLHKDVWHHSIHWENKTHTHMFAISRSTIKRDWWKTRKELKAKFFSAEWKYKYEDTTRTGIYIGRVAVVYLMKKKKEGEH